MSIICAQIFSHPKYKLVNYQADVVLGAHSFSYLEEWSPIVFNKENVREEALVCTEIPGAHYWYRKCASGVPNGLKDAICAGNALLVYRQGQDVSFEP